MEYSNIYIKYSTNQIPDQHKLKDIENGIHQKSEKVNEMTNLMDQKMSQLNLLMDSLQDKKDNIPQINENINEKKDNIIKNITKEIIDESINNSETEKSKTNK